jgi:hypothetical protein
MVASIPQDAAPPACFYRVACVATVHIEQRSTVWWALAADTIIIGREVLPPGWVAWEQDGTIRGYLHRGDLDILHGAAS